jgi:hypothetical protein
MFAFILTAFKWLGPSMFSMLRGVFTGGTLEKILDSIDKKFDNETEREKVKADVTKTYVNAQVQLLVGGLGGFNYSLSSRLAFGGLG